MENVCEAVSAPEQLFDDRVLLGNLLECRSVLSEYGIRGMSAEDALSKLQELLRDRQMTVRKVVGRDAARLEISSEGIHIRYDWEGDRPLEGLLENRLLLPTVLKERKLDGDFVIGDGPCMNDGMLRDRLAYLRDSAQPFAYSMELRTRRFRAMLEDVSAVSGLGFEVSYGVPVYYEEGRTPYSRKVSSSLRITDRTDGRTVWEGTALVVDDGSDIARMRCFRRLFENAGLFGRIPTDGGLNTMERRDLDGVSGIEW